MDKDIAAATQRYIDEIRKRRPEVEIEIVPEHMDSEDVNIRVLLSRQEDFDDVSDAMDGLVTDIYLDTNVYILAYIGYDGPVPVDAD